MDHSEGCVKLKVSRYSHLKFKTWPNESKVKDHINIVSMDLKYKIFLVTKISKYYKNVTFMLYTCGKIHFILITAIITYYEIMILIFIGYGRYLVVKK